jgi:type VI secretion system protein ImpL
MLAAFDSHFDELAEGIKEMSLTHMAMQRGREVSPGLLSLPLEFVGIKPALRTFIATLFEDNPYQFKPVFRGFYFSSALQEGRSVHTPPSASAASSPGARLERGRGADRATAFFLKDLFRKVIFADKELVRQYSSPHQNRLRYGVFLGAVGAGAGAGPVDVVVHHQRAAGGQCDLDQAVRVQKDRMDLKSRIDALLLQDRMEQLDRYGARGHHHPSGPVPGHGHPREAAARVQPRHAAGDAGADRIEPGELSGPGGAERDKLGQGTSSAAESEVLYQNASPTSTNDAYNALKTYLMLGNPKYVEGAHLSHQLTLFWRTWLEANRGR